MQCIHRRRARQHLFRRKSLDDLYPVPTLQPAAHMVQPDVRGVRARRQLLRIYLQLLEPSVLLALRIAVVDISLRCARMHLEKQFGSHVHIRLFQICIGITNQICVYSEHIKHMCGMFHQHASVLISGSLRPMCCMFHPAHLKRAWRGGRPFMPEF